MARIMIVDSASAQRQRMAGELAAAGHTVAEAANMQAALAQLAVALADVVMVDMVSSTAGIELIKTLHSALSEVKLVAYVDGESPVSMNDLLLAAQAFGAERILYGPFTREELHAAIEALLH
jgi:CheY-like chemotaxis protein